MYSFTSCPLAAAPIVLRVVRVDAASQLVRVDAGVRRFCKKAKELLDEKGAPYAVVELDEIADGAARRARLGAKTGRTSVPSVWISGEYVGGLNDGPGLAVLDRAGELDAKLAAAGRR